VQSKMSPPTGWKLTSRVVSVCLYSPGRGGKLRSSLGLPPRSPHSRNDHPNRGYPGAPASASPPPPPYPVPANTSKRQSRSTFSYRFVHSRGLFSLLTPPQLRPPYFELSDFFLRAIVAPFTRPSFPPHREPIFRPRPLHYCSSLPPSEALASSAFLRRQRQQRTFPTET